MEALLAEGLKVFAERSLKLAFGLECTRGCLRAVLMVVELCVWV